jgi:hypothetical protein
MLVRGLIGVGSSPDIGNGGCARAGAAHFPYFFCKPHESIASPAIRVSISVTDSPRARKAAQRNKNQLRDERKTKVFMGFDPAAKTLRNSIWR